MHHASELAAYTRTTPGQISRIVAWFGASLLLHLTVTLLVGPQPSSLHRPLPLLVNLQVATVQPEPKSVIETPVPATEPIPLVAAPLATEPEAKPDRPPTPAVKTDPLLDYLQAQMLDTRAELLHEVNLIYPERALKFRIAGIVRLVLFINENGDVDNVTIVEAKPPEIFDQAAKDAALALKYKPAEKSGRPVKSRRTIEVTFDPYNRAESREAGQR